MDESQRLLERLPDYLNGHVDGADAQQIAHLLEHDAGWRAQAALMADLRGAIDAELAQMDSAHGLATLRARINAPPRPTWWQRMTAQPRVLQGALATLAVVCGAQAWMLGHPHDASTGIAWRDAPLTVAAPAANLRVRFAADATLAQVEAALVRSRARLVAGPQGQHDYLLQADDAPAALAQLRASAGVRDAALLSP